MSGKKPWSWESILQASCPLLGIPVKPSGPLTCQIHKLDTTGSKTSTQASTFTFLINFFKNILFWNNKPQATFRELHCQWALHRSHGVLYCLTQWQKVVRATVSAAKGGFSCSERAGGCPDCLWTIPLNPSIRKCKWRLLLPPWRHREELLTSGAGRWESGHRGTFTVLYTCSGTPVDTKHQPFVLITLLICVGDVNKDGENVASRWRHPLRKAKLRHGRERVQERAYHLF